MELDSLPRIPARWFQHVEEPRHVNHIVVHDMEAPEKGDTAESVGRYFARGEDDGEIRKASAHIGVDDDSAVRYVNDNDIAYGAPGANHDGLHLELAGYQRQTREEWLDAFGLAMLGIAAEVAALWCIKYDIPVKHLTNYELRADARGFVGHDQVSSVYQKSDHTDPGPNFPWDMFMELVEGCLAARRPAELPVAGLSDAPTTVTV